MECSRQSEYATKGPKVQGNISTFEKSMEDQLAGFQRASVGPHEAERSGKPEPLDVALWVLLRSLPLGATRNQIIRGPAPGAPRKFRFLEKRVATLF